VYSALVGSSPTRTKVLPEERHDFQFVSYPAISAAATICATKPGHHCM
jgi:hypothetical protein